MEHASCKRAFKHLTRNRPVLNSYVGQTHLTLPESQIEMVLQRPDSLHNTVGHVDIYLIKIKSSWYGIAEIIPYFAWII